MAFQPPLPEFGDRRFGFVPGRRPRVFRGRPAHAPFGAAPLPPLWRPWDVSQRRDYDLRHRVDPDHSPGDPPLCEEPRPSRPLAEWLRRRRAGGS